MLIDKVEFSKNCRFFYRYEIEEQYQLRERTVHPNDTRLHKKKFAAKMLRQEFHLAELRTADIYGLFTTN